MLYKASVSADRHDKKSVLVSAAKILIGASLIIINKYYCIHCICKYNKYIKTGYKYISIYLHICIIKFIKSYNFI